MFDPLLKAEKPTLDSTWSRRCRTLDLYKTKLSVLERQVNLRAPPGRNRAQRRRGASSLPYSLYGSTAVPPTRRALPLYRSVRSSSGSSTTPTASSLRKSYE